MTKEVVIIGGGFGGVRVAEWLSGHLRDAHMTIVDKSPYHTFSADLYEVATADLPEAYNHLPIEFYDLRASAAYPLEDVFRNHLNVSVLQKEVAELDFAKHEVRFKDGGAHAYDVLVLAVGSESNYFNIPHLEEHALPLKNLWDALSVRNALDEAFTQTPKTHRITIAIGGGGFTGCEFAGELAHFVKKLAREHGRAPELVDLVIVEASSMLLGGASPWAQHKARQRLESLGIKILFEKPITDVQDHTIVFKDGSTMSYDLLIWTAGVRANALTKACDGAALQKNLCVCVDEFLRMSPHQNVFGVGDMTYCIDEASGKSYPMTATVALAEGTHVAKNIIRFFEKKPLTPFYFKSTGFVIPLGGKYALFERGKIHRAGFLPWILKHMITLHYWWSILGWRPAWRLWRRDMRIFLKND